MTTALKGDLAALKEETSATRFGYRWAARIVGEMLDRPDVVFGIRGER